MKFTQWLNSYSCSRGSLLCFVQDRRKYLEFKVKGQSLIIELAEIDGSGEGVLPTLTSLAHRYAKQRGLRKVERVVHALNCAEPNLKLRRVMERRGFQVVDVERIGKAYYQVHEIV